MTKTIKLSTLLSTGKLWEKGEHSRVYLGRIEVAKALGFDWESYKTGNPKHAIFDGDKISNNEMWGVLMNIDGAYYDNKRKQLGAADKFLALLPRYDIEIVDDVNVEAEAPERSDTHARRSPRRCGPQACGPRAQHDPPHPRADRDAQGGRRQRLHAHPLRRPHRRHGRDPH